MAKLLIPTPLRKFTDNQSSFNTDGATVKEAVSQLSETYPDLQKHLLDEEGHIRNFVRIYVGDEDIKSLDNEETKIDETSVISIIPAIAGGVNQKGNCIV